MQDKVCISVLGLYEKYGEELTYTRIEHETWGDEYYDLYNDSEQRACMDGESCKVLSEDNGVITLLNTEGEVDMTFRLTEEEFKIATFKG